MRSISIEVTELNAVTTTCSLMLAMILVAAEPETKPPKSFHGPDGRARALKEIVDAPIYDGFYPGMFTSRKETRVYVASDLTKCCAEAINFLVRTKSDVDQQLLKLARSNQELRVRYRAAYILAQRGKEEAGSILLEMGLSKDADERMAAWHAHRWALDEKKLKAPVDLTRALKQYSQERDPEIREELEWFLGSCRSREAVKPLLRTVEMNRHATAAIWALGEIGDPAAVPVIIKRYSKDDNPHYSLQALGKLATPEAVDFVIEHLGEYGAVEALVASKSDKALPALRKHFETIQKAQGDEGSDFAITRVAIIRLSEKDPRETLLKIFEDRKEKLHVRTDALRALQNYDTKPFNKRILDLYRNDPNDDIKRFCIWLLAEEMSKEVTEAMIDHALVHKVTSMSDLATQHYLIDGLNKRLETDYTEMKDLQDYLRKRQKKP